jgi:hypothetical protein
VKDRALTHDMDKRPAVMQFVESSSLSNAEKDKVFAVLSHATVEIWENVHAIGTHFPGRLDAALLGLIGNILPIYFNIV